MKRLAKVVGTLGLVGFAAMNGPFAVAADSGWYLGFGVGESGANIDVERIDSSLLGSGFSSTTTTEDDLDFGYKVFGGYQFNRNFALEAGYFNLGEFSYRTSTVPTGTLDGRIEIEGLNLDAVGILPISERFSAFGRVGVNYAEAKDTFTGTGAVNVTNPNPSKREANYKYGAGLQWDMTKSLAMRLEAERYRINDAVGNKGDINLLSVGLVYQFGQKAPAPAPRAATPPPPPPPPPVAAPAPVAAVAAAPVLVIVPIPQKTQQYCSNILDVQFEINQKTVQRVAEEKIDEVAVFMRKYPETTAVIEGHSDEVGTTAENMRLSQRRADSVVSYLSDRGIDRSRLKAVGYGETRPIADNQTEIGRRLNRRVNAVIACATDIAGLKAAPARIALAVEMEYDVNGVDVKPKYREELSKVARFMAANPRVTATVEGHTSNVRGGASREEAMRLSERRAQNVVNYLADNFGTAHSRLSAEGFGATRRFAYNTSAEGRQENRRVNIIFDFPPR